MVDVRAVIGDANTRKSTTIHALTGVRQIEPAWQVAFQPAAQSIQTYVRPRSLQETGSSPQQLIADVTASGSTQLIVALRYNGIRYQSGAVAYLNAFIAAGWNIHSIVTFGNNNPLHGFNGMHIPNTHLLPSNQIAAMIRPHFGIV